jgi:hypothetical protein
MKASGFIGLIFFAATLIASAQHFDPFYLRPAACEPPASETVLSGMDIYSATIPQIIEKLGKPKRTDFLDSEDGPTRRYEWETDSSLVRIGTVKEIGGGEELLSIDVWRRRPEDEIGTTGEGLTLGSRIGDAQRVYGCRFRYDAHPSRPQFFRDFSNRHQRGCDRSLARFGGFAG